jgi:uncharacterized protein (TIGR02996 family)
MSDEAFLRMILDKPDADEPRLIYADWLEERGRPLGEFIRIQCESARLPPGSRLREAMEERERELLSEHAEEWLGPFRGLATRWTFRRGLLQQVSVPPRIYLEQGSMTRTIPYCRIAVDLQGFAVPLPVLEEMPESVARENVVLPLAKRGKRWMVAAMMDPEDLDLIEKLEFILNYFVEPVSAPAEQIVDAINRLYGQIETESVDSVHYALEGDAREILLQS